MTEKYARPDAIQALMPENDPTNPADHRCEGAEFHSPRPLRVSGYRLADGHIVWLCGTCADNIEVFIKLSGIDGPLPWSVQRCWGNKARQVGTRVIASRRRK